jgi:hypothetical protein
MGKIFSVIRLRSHFKNYVLQKYTTDTLKDHHSFPGGGLCKKTRKRESTKGEMPLGASRGAAWMVFAADPKLWLRAPMKPQL